MSAWSLNIVTGCADYISIRFTIVIDVFIFVKVTYTIVKDSR